MTKNNKGFAVTEVLILSTVIIGVLVFMYAQFKSINRSYQYSFEYDTVGGMYLANNIVNFINNDNYDKLVEVLMSKSENYLDITDCNNEIFKSSNFCLMIMEQSQVEKVIFTEENLTKIRKNMLGLEPDLKNYINQIQTTNEKNDYRIIVKFKDGTFSSMRFNKGKAYIENGLIAYLDGINNTGNGHSTTQLYWTDMSGNNNNAQTFNNPEWTNNSIIFNGTDNYAKIGTTSSAKFNNGITIETRIKIQRLTGFDGKDYISIINNESGNNGENSINQNIVKTDSKLQTKIYIGSEFYTIETQPEINIGNYYTLTTTYDNSKLRFYVNGSLIGEQEVEGTYAGTDNPFNIGKKADSEDYANVEYQKVLIYNRALSENEVIRNYQADQARY